MPNTKSAERRMRSSARRQVRNQSLKNRIRTLEKQYLVAVGGGQKEPASAAFKSLASALDKGTKQGVVHANTADRRKSRLSSKLNALPA